MCSGETEAERSAAAWHDAAGEEHQMDSSCWCCCISCELDNPHFEAAQAALKQWAAEQRAAKAKRIADHDKLGPHGCDGRCANLT